MKTGKVKTLSVKKRFIYWIKERESIRLKKEGDKPKPWTDDVILQSYRFCNVVRADDKVSKWLIKNWYEPNFNHPNMLIACALARFFNEPSTLHEIGFPTRWNPKQVKKKLKNLADMKTTIFNGAYIITGTGMRGKPKWEGVIDYFVTPLAKLRNKVDKSSMENTWNMLTQCKGFGSFTAGQVVADLVWSTALKGDERDYPSWEDREYWAPIGPGSKRGMNRILERDIKTSISQFDFVAALGHFVMPLESQIDHGLSNRMTAMDFQNCLCEFDGYERVLWGEGRKKQRYSGV